MKKLICLITCIALLLFLCLPAWAESAPSLSLGDQAVTVIKGKTTKFAPKAENVANTKKLKYTWESSDPEVARDSAAPEDIEVAQPDGQQALVTPILLGYSYPPTTCLLISELNWNKNHQQCKSPYAFPYLYCR